jgi:hypothetical protein
MRRKADMADVLHQFGIKSSAPEDVHKALAAIEGVSAWRGSTVRSAADWLCLAATPAFAAMALLALLDDGRTDILCAGMQHSSPLGGMVAMYVLMSVFHCAPWLKLIGKTAPARPVSAIGAVRSAARGTTVWRQRSAAGTQPERQRVAGRCNNEVNEQNRRDT